jgi:hypothetical protein
MGSKSALEFALPSQNVTLTLDRKVAEELALALSQALNNPSGPKPGKLGVLAKGKTPKTVGKTVNIQAKSKGKPASVPKSKPKKK